MKKEKLIWLSNILKKKAAEGNQFALEVDEEVKKMIEECNDKKIEEKIEVCWYCGDKMKKSAPPICLACRRTILRRNK